jgi:hypothetical protein
VVISPGTGYWIDSMKSNAPAPDFELHATAEDIAALRRARAAAARMTGEEYLRFLARFTWSPAALRARRGPRGEPFKL